MSRSVEKQVSSERLAKKPQKNQWPWCGQESGSRSLDRRRGRRVSRIYVKKTL